MEFHHIDDSEGDPPAELAEHFEGEAKIHPLTSPSPKVRPSSPSVGRRQVR